MNRLERLCTEHGLRMSEQRRIILRVLGQANDHPCADEIHRRVLRLEPRISMATVYRTLNILAEAGILSRVELGDGKAHYEEAGDGPHEHLIDVETGKVLEFSNGDIEALLRDAAGRLGYRLLKYRLEVFAASEATADALIDQPADERGDRAVAYGSAIVRSRPALSENGLRPPGAVRWLRPVRRRPKIGGKD